MRSQKTRIGNIPCGFVLKPVLPGAKRLADQRHPISSSAMFTNSASTHSKLRMVALSAM